ncbi:hypothetical protein [Rhodococcus sp. H29-C3]|uniref:hypothetical protein n=3 Tax=unclassified Rhodococcus (in: high G+C Gram-positive bacteria) TaxID=192944 RepID=UPI0024B98643|nr:hypothetical protein [Rhodococcus sp. H29-C3]MDJ0358965.1 hypothetical protein [Rhodococcus sp. H29-C3]
MTLTVAEVSGWRPASLINAGRQLSGIVSALDSQRAGVLQEQNALADTWHGEAAIAAAERVVGECSLVSSVAEVLQSVADELTGSGGIVDGVRNRVVEVVSDATTRCFDVEASGMVNADKMIALCAVITGPASEDAALAFQLEAAELTRQLLEALRQAEAAAEGVSSRLAAHIAIAQDLALLSSNGNVVVDVDGGFSWQPDYPATFASATVGVMTDVTGKGLTSAAVSSVDDVGKLIGKGFGPAGAVLGVIPAIHNDIAGGMSPTAAIVTEGTAAAGGYLVGSVAGGVVGTFIPIPVVGTAIGVGVGAALGGLVAWGGSKVMQNLWD